MNNWFSEEFAWDKWGENTRDAEPPRDRDPDEEYERYREKAMQDQIDKKEGSYGLGTDW